MLPLAFVFMFFTALVFTALGTAIASRLQDMQAFPLIMNFLVMPLFFLSGSIFPLEGFPKAVVIASKFNPLVYGVDGLRGALAGSAHLGMVSEFLILSGITALFVAIGGYLFSKIEI